MRLLDVLFRRTAPPDTDRARRAAHVDELERDADGAIRLARAALAEARRQRLAAAVDDAARALRSHRL